MSEEAAKLKVVIEGDASHAKKEIQEAGAAVEKFTRDATGRLRDASGKFVQTGQAAQEMGEDVKKAGEQSTRTFDLMIAAANREVSALRGGASPAVADLMGKHKDLTRIQAEQIIKTQELASKFTQQASASSVCGKALSNLTSIATTALGTLAGNLMTQAVNGITMLTQKAVQGYGDLEQAVANISTIKPQIDTTAVFASLNEMQTRVPQSAADLADSLYDVFSSINVSQKQGLQLVEQFAKGATGAGTDAKTFGTAVVGVMNAYKLSVKDAAHISDMFFSTVNAGVVSGTELASNLGEVTKSAKLAGQSTETLFAAIAAVTKEGGTASTNINNLNNVLSKLTSDDARKMFKSLNVEIFDSKGNIRDLSTILTDLKPKLEKMSEKDMNLKIMEGFKDQQARSGLLTLISQLDTLKGQMKVNAEAIGVTEEAYKKMSGTFQSQSKILGNTLNALATSIGAELLPAVMPFIKSLAHDLPQAIGQVKPFFAQFKTDVAAAFAPFKPIVDDIITWFRENFPLIQQTAQTIMRTIGEFWKAHGADIVAVIRGVVNVVLGLLKMVMQILNGDWKGAFETAKKTVVGFGETLFHTFALLGDLLLDTFNRMIKATVGFGRDTIAGLIQGIKEKQPALYQVVNTLAGGIPEAIRSLLQIRSPSRVTHELGQFAAMGLITGITSMQAQIAVTVQKMVQPVLDARARMRELIKASERELLVAKYGDNSAAVLRFDNPALPRDEAINAAAAIAKNKETVAAMQEHQKALADIADMTARMQAEQDQIIADAVFRMNQSQNTDLQKQVMAAMGQITNGFFAPNSGMTLDEFNRSAQAQANAPAATRSSSREFGDSMLGEAQRVGRQFLSTLLGGGSTNRAATLRGLLGDFQSTAINAVSDMLFRSFKPNMEQVTKGIGDMIGKTLRGVNASVYAMLSQTYSLLAMVGAQNRKKSTGGLIGAALGGILAIATGGAALPFITAGAAAGSFLSDPDLGGALNVAAALGGAGVFGGSGGGGFVGEGASGSGSFGGGGFGNPAIGGGFGGGFNSRAVQVNVDLHGDINNLGGIDQMQGAIVDAVQTGLRTN